MLRNTLGEKITRAHTWHTAALVQCTCSTDSSVEVFGAANCFLKICKQFKLIFLSGTNQLFIEVKLFSLYAAKMDWIILHVEI